MSENNINNLCAFRLKEALNDNSIRAIDLAEKTGLSKATISHYVTGTRIPTRDNAKLISDVLGVNPAWLMGFPVSKYVDEISKRREALILTYFAQLNPELQESVLNLIKTMI